MNRTACIIASMVFLFVGSPLSATTLSELRAQAEAVPMVPQPTPGKGCPIPPIPNDVGAVEGEGWSIDRLIAWRNFSLAGQRYYIEYQILKRNEDGGVTTRPFPSSYWLDLNRNGVFELPGEVWLDTQGNGRCDDLELMAPRDGERSMQPHA